MAQQHCASTVGKFRMLARGCWLQEVGRGQHSQLHAGRWVVLQQHPATPLHVRAQAAANITRWNDMRCTLAQKSRNPLRSTPLMGHT